MCEQTHQAEDRFLPTQQSCALNLAGEEERKGTEEEGWTCKMKSYRRT